MAKANPTVAVVANQTTAALGSTIFFTATVSGPTNAVGPAAVATSGQWIVLGVPGISSCSSVTGPVAGGTSNISTYTCSIVASRAGTYQASFTYPGDTAYNSVTAVTSSNSTYVNVGQLNYSLSQSGSTTLGGSILWTVTLVGSTNATAPTGAVNWSIGGTAGQTACANTSGPSILGNTTTYTCTLSTPAAGTYTVAAAFAGDSNYPAQAVGSSTITVALQTPTITLAYTGGVQQGDSAILTTTVSGILGAVTPSGSVSWYVTDPHGSVVSCPAYGTPTNTNGVKTFQCQLTNVQAGTYQATSTIAADSNYISVTSSNVSISVAVTSPSFYVTATPTSPTVSCGPFSGSASKAA